MKIYGEEVLLPPARLTPDEAATIRARAIKVAGETLGKDLAKDIKLLEVLDIPTFKEELKAAVIAKLKDDFTRLVAEVVDESIRYWHRD